jgi:hypothetical protein
MDRLRREFLAGERPDDVCLYLSGIELADAGAGADALVDAGESVDGGVVLVLDGERGRSAFERATGVDPMDFAGTAMQTDGHVAPDLTDGECPGGGDDHALRFTFAFVEARNEEVGGIYAEGPVVHAYAACTCGETYSQRWVAGTRGTVEGGEGA